VNLAAKLLGGIIVAVYLVLLGIGIRAGSRIASVTAFAYYALNLVASLFASPTAGFNPIIQIIVMALLLGSVRASFFLAVEHRRNAASDLPPELPETAYYDSAPPELVALARRDRGFEERIKKGWAAISPMPQILVGLSWCFIVAGVLLVSVVHLYAVPTGSMEPTLQIGDRVIALNYPFARPIRRGDTVVFRMPYDMKITTVKRVVGLPGDRIQVLANRLTLNGKPVTEPYTQALPGFPVSDFPSDSPLPFAPPELQKAHDLMYVHDIRNHEYIVPPNGYFVLGDNRGNSLDSRYFGAVPRAGIAGRLIYVYGNTKRRFSAKSRWLRFSFGAS
jgi:signal peptidase I